MKYESPEKKMFRIVFPPVLYYFLSMMVQVIVSTVLIIFDINSTSVNEATVSKSVKFFDHINAVIIEHSVLMNTISAGIGLITFLFLYIHDIKTDGKDNIIKEVKSINMFNALKCYAVGATLGTGLSMFISLLPLDNIIGSYEDTSALLMNSNFLVLFISLGIIVPIAEELIYRGIVYNRVKKYSNDKIAIIVSALAFGIFHFNLVQIVFAGVMGIVLAYVYSRYKTITAPILLHMAVNQISVIFTCTGFDRYLNSNMLVYNVFMIILIVMGAYIIIKKDFNSQSS